MDPKPGPVRWGPKGPVVGGDFIVVRENGPIKWGHNGDGVVELMEFDDAKLLEEFRRYEQDRLFLEAHRAQWLEQYPDMFVAVYQEKLVGVASTIDELVAQTRAQGVPPGQSYRAFLDSDPAYLASPG